jgi:amino acid transporter
MILDLTLPGSPLVVWVGVGFLALLICACFYEMAIRDIARNVRRGRSGRVIGDVIVGLFVTVVVTVVATIVGVVGLAALLRISPMAPWIAYGVIALLILGKLLKSSNSKERSQSPKDRDPSGNDAYNPNPPRYTKF